MKTVEKQKAISLREGGESIKEIAKKLGVSKGSVSVWVRNITLSSKQLKKLKDKEHSVTVINKRRESRLRNEFGKRSIIINNAKGDIDSISKKELQLVGAILYWAEGRKRGKRIVTFSNSDPEIIQIMMRFFREICHVNSKKFRAQIHTYSHLNSAKSEEYWSKISGIPRAQFYKTYSKPSKAGKNKMDSLPYGTVDINVCDSVLFLTVKGWIEKISHLILNETKN